MNTGTDGRTAHAPGAQAPPGPDAAEALGGYLRTQAAGFLRGLGRYTGAAGSPGTADRAAEAVAELRAPARRIGATLHTCRPLLDAAWADGLRAELAWLSGTLAAEYRLDARLRRLDEALLLAGDTAPAGASRAAALLTRRLTLARNRARAKALQAAGSSRFHAVADAVALLASEVPLAPGTAGRPAARLLGPAAEQPGRRLAEAVAALPPSRTGDPCHTGAPARSPGTTERQDAVWDRLRTLLHLHRCAEELLRSAGASRPARIPADAPAASAALDRHREAARAASAASAAAATPRIAPATAYVLGVLHAGQRHEVQAARSAFHRAWGTGAG